MSRFFIYLPFAFQSFVRLYTSQKITLRLQELQTSSVHQQKPSPVNK